MATKTDTTLGRFYDIDGERYPSVTTILGCIGKPALIGWAAKEERTLCLEAAASLYLDVAQTPTMSRAAYLATLQGRIGKERAHKRLLAKAGDIGTQIHVLIEWNLRRSLGQTVGPEPRVVEDATWAFMAFEDWAASAALKPLLIEQQVWSRTHRYAGTMDLLAEVNGQVTLVDFKSGKAVYGEAHLQNVAYQVALAEMGHATAEAGLILRLPKMQTDPAFETVPVPPVTELFSTFLAVRQLWTWAYAQEVAWHAKRAT